MAEIEFTHQGFKITFSENDEVWRCWTLNFEDKSLSKLKQKINKHISVTLKKVTTPFALLSSWGGGDIVKCSIISRDAKSGRFWVVKEGENRRSQVEPKYLAPWTKEIEDRLAEADEVTRRGKALLREADAIRKKITAMTEEEIESFLANLMKTVEDEAD